MVFVLPRILGLLRQIFPKRMNLIKSSNESKCLNFLNSRFYLSRSVGFEQIFFLLVNDVHLVYLKFSKLKIFRWNANWIRVPKPDWNEKKWAILKNQNQIFFIWIPKNCKSIKIHSQISRRFCFCYFCFFDWKEKVIVTLTSTNGKGQQSLNKQANK